MIPKLAVNTIFFKGASICPTDLYISTSAININNINSDKFYKITVQPLRILWFPGRKTCRPTEELGGL